MWTLLDSSDLGCELRGRQRVRGAQVEDAGGPLRVGVLSAGPGLLFSPWSRPASVQSTFAETPWVGSPGEFWGIQLNLNFRERIILCFRHPWDLLTLNVSLPPSAYLVFTNGTFAFANSPLNI